MGTQVGFEKRSIIQHACVIAVLCLFSTLLPSAAVAQNFSTTNLQLLYGGSFHDRYYGYNTPSGDLTTVTLEHYSTWRYGDNFCFVDFLSGNLADFGGSPIGDQSHAYGEWYPRMSLSKLSKKKVALGPVTDTYIASGWELGRGFRGYLVGVGCDLKVPGFNSASLNVYRRDDNLNRPTYQVTTCWSKPIRVKSLRLSCDGYVDIAGTDADGTDLNTQVQLLADVSRLTGARVGKAQAGLEWYYHRNRNLTASVPQLVLKWTLQ